jgi:hypothetical protein
MFKRKPRIMRDKPTPDNQYLARWYRHVQQVGDELANAAAPPPWGIRLARGVRDVAAAIWRDADFWSEPIPASITRPAIPPRHEPTCAHDAARMTTLGALIREPKVADAVFDTVEAMTCPACGLTVAVLR